MANTLFDRTIAFASICQSVKLVQEVARTGDCDHDLLYSSLHSITITNPSSTLDTFGSEKNLELGLKVLSKEIENTKNSQELTRYLINLLALERKLTNNKAAMSTLGQRLDTVQRQLQHFELLDEQMISNLASIYLDIISPLGPRIQVLGQPTQLQRISVQHKIRALLLSGVRSTVLWRQVGGRKRQLVFSRKQMIEQANLILTRIS